MKIDQRKGVQLLGVSSLELRLLGNAIRQMGNSIRQVLLSNDVKPSRTDARIDVSSFCFKHV